MLYWHRQSRHRRAFIDTSIGRAEEATTHRCCHLFLPSSSPLQPPTQTWNRQSFILEKYRNGITTTTTNNNINTLVSSARSGAKALRNQECDDATKHCTSSTVLLLPRRQTSWHHKPWEASYPSPLSPPVPHSSLFASTVRSRTTSVILVFYFKCNRLHHP